MWIQLRSFSQSKYKKQFDICAGLSAHCAGAVASQEKLPLNCKGGTLMNNAFIVKIMCLIDRCN